MTEKEKIEHLSDKLDELIDHFADEWDMSYASVVGVLQMKIFLLCAAAEDAGNQTDNWGQ